MLAPAFVSENRLLYYLQPPLIVLCIYEQETNITVKELEIMITAPYLHTSCMYSSESDHIV